MNDELFILKKDKRDIAVSKLTCNELAQAMATAPDPNIPETTKLAELWLKIGSRELRLLRLCGGESALGWASKIKSAAIVENAPTIELIVGGGSPKPMVDIKATKTARRIAAANEIPLRNLNGRAAILVPKRTIPPPIQTSKEGATKQEDMTLNDARIV